MRKDKESVKYVGERGLVDGNVMKIHLFGRGSVDVPNERVKNI